MFKYHATLSRREFLNAIRMGGAMLRATAVLASVLLPLAPAPAVFYGASAQMLPARYYNCIETKPEDLYAAYLAPNARNTYADQQFNDEVFVFKNVKITQLCWTRANRTASG